MLISEDQKTKVLKKIISFFIILTWVGRQYTLMDIRTTAPTPTPVLFKWKLMRSRGVGRGC